MDLKKLSEHVEYARKHELPGWLLTVADLDELLVYIGKLVAEKTQAECRLFDSTEAHTQQMENRATAANACIKQALGMAAAPGEIDLSNIACWMLDRNGQLCQTVEKAADIKYPGDTFIRLSALLEAQHQTKAPPSDGINQRVYHCVFDGLPPKGYDNWNAWLQSPHKTGVFMRAVTDKDFERSSSAEAPSTPAEQAQEQAAIPVCLMCNGATVVGTPGEACPGCSTPSARRLNDAMQALAQRAVSGEAKPAETVQEPYGWVFGIGFPQLHVGAVNPWKESACAFPVYTAPPAAVQSDDDATQWKDGYSHGFEAGKWAATSEQSDSERDAARYRWLRHGDNDEKVIRMSLPSYDPYLLRNDLLDVTIDAAMAAATPQTREG